MGAQNPCTLINELKLVLTKDEFWNMAEQLADFKRKGNDQKDQTGLLAAQRPVFEVHFVKLGKSLSWKSAIN